MQQHCKYRLEQYKGLVLVLVSNLLAYRFMRENKIPLTQLGPRNTRNIMWSTEGKIFASVISNQVSE